MSLEENDEALWEKLNSELLIPLIEGLLILQPDWTSADTLHTKVVLP